MIVTRSWLNEFVDLTDIKTDQIVDALNSIGLEVDNVKSYKIPPKVVVGYVKSVTSHPNANKLNICEVDLGSSVRQIVCGARNVESGQYVPVAMIGCKLSENFTIKPTKLRGEQSDGMICSSLEIGLPKIGDGIMVLDESISNLELGSELRDNEILNDDVIEIELTANRGDALSIYGVARDLSVKLKRSFDFKGNFKDINSNGIGRFFKLSYKTKVQSKVAYKMANLDFDKNIALVLFRLALIGEYDTDNQKNIVSYITHTIGVLLKSYNYDLLYDTQKELSVLYIKTNKHGADEVYDKDEQLLTSIGIKSVINHDINGKNRVIYEASFRDADYVSKIVHQNSLDSDELFYKSSRGSQSDLLFAINYLSWFLQEYYDAEIYSGMSEYSKNSEDKRIYISLSFRKTILKR